MLESTSKVLFSVGRMKQAFKCPFKDYLLLLYSFSHCLQTVEFAEAVFLLLVRTLCSLVPLNEMLAILFLL